MASIGIRRAVGARTQAAMGSAVVPQVAVIKLQAERASIETPSTAHYSAFVAVR
ncbi:hypothetical protein ACTJI2_07475 [Pseudoxanthomonas sp. 22568]|uniref:hypothetical protein n=1 Tax=unclassified Pseudoxanthomonas TaxID=2645906 RepID=UPI00177FC4AC|nr:hypothetical protein [Pseudoxanthomonas sp. PXM04]MBD9376884.1 hypothetical protein [Pseudoxanthomonas sp. PXM04]